MPRRRRQHPDSPPGQVQGEETIAVLAYWEPPEQVPIVFANHIFARLLDGQFLVMFGQAELPYELTLRKETLERLKKEGIPIRPVARLAIAPQRMGEMIAALNQVYDSWQKTQREMPTRGQRQ